MGQSIKPIHTAKVKANNKTMWLTSTRLAGLTRGVTESFPAPQRSSSSGAGARGGSGRRRRGSRYYVDNFVYAQFMTALGVTDLP